MPKEIEPVLTIIPRPDGDFEFMKAAPNDNPELPDGMDFGIITKSQYDALLQKL